MKIKFLLTLTGFVVLSLGLLSTPAEARRRRKKKSSSEEVLAPKDKFSRSLPITIFDADKNLWTTVMDKKIMATRGYREQGSWTRDGKQLVLKHSMVKREAPADAKAEEFEIRYSLDDSGPSVRINGVEGKIDEFSESNGIVGPVWSIKPEAPAVAK